MIFFTFSFLTNSLGWPDISKLQLMNVQYQVYKYSHFTCPYITKRSKDRKNEIVEVGDCIYFMIFLASGLLNLTK